MNDSLDQWLDTCAPAFRSGFYAGLAKAREAHALDQNRRGLDTDALKHMQVAKYYEERAKTIGTYLMGEAA